MLLVFYYWSEFNLFAEHRNVILDSVSKKVLSEKCKRVNFQLCVENTLGTGLIDVWF